MPFYLAAIALFGDLDLRKTKLARFACMVEVTLIPSLDKGRRGNPNALLDLHATYDLKAPHG